MRPTTKRKDREKVHDRRATDTLAAGDYASIEVVDPFDPESKITVFRQTRGDPLGRLHAHHQIDDAQYLAGRRYQRDLELAGRGAKAIDPTKEAVDGGCAIDPLPNSQVEATARLVAVHAVLGRQMQGALDGVLMAGLHVEHMAIQMFGRPGDRWANYYGRMFRDALDMLAVEYGLATRR